MCNDMMMRRVDTAEGAGHQNIFHFAAAQTRFRFVRQTFFHGSWNIFNAQNNSLHPCALPGAPLASSHQLEFNHSLCTIPYVLSQN